MRQHLSGVLGAIAAALVYRCLRGETAFEVKTG
jgi:hypothetical protein